MKYLPATAFVIGLFILTIVAICVTKDLYGLVILILGFVFIEDVMPKIPESDENHECQKRRRAK
jgi:hypothetical protein